MSPKLPDYLAPSLRLVICGSAAGKTSASLGHYYAGSGNLFWTYLFRAGITTQPLFASTDFRVLEFRVGLTDLAKKIAASSDRGLRRHYDVDAFVSKIERYRPPWVAFHGKEAARVVSRSLGKGSEVSLGEQTWSIGHANVFVLPSASGANRDASRLEGKTDRVQWFKDLAMQPLHRALVTLGNEVELDPRLRELVNLRASILNGCAYCIDKHTKIARRAGESEQRLHAVAAWHDAPLRRQGTRSARAHRRGHSD
jgi:TDG/mug DNA glycosylase family protein